MGAFSCFNCFGGQKAKRLESPEPGPRPHAQGQEEKNANASPKVSTEHQTVEKEKTKKSTGVPRLVVPEIRSSSPLDVTSSPLSEFKLDLPPSPAAETAIPTFPVPDAKKKPTARTSGDSSGASKRPPIPGTQPIRTVSVSSSVTSKPTSRGSSLKQTSTKATTPPLTPADAKKPEPLPVLQRTVTPKQETTDVKADSPTLTKEDEIKVIRSPITSPQDLTLAPVTSRTRTPSPHPPISPALKASQPEIASPQLLPVTASLPPRTSSSSPAPGRKSSSPARKPTLDINTAQLSASTKPDRRPSYENDTPTTTTTPNPLDRISTAPPDAEGLGRSISTTTKAKAEKRKSRLSRFLSTRETSSSSNLGSKRKSMRASRAFVSLGKDKETGAPVAEMPSLKEVDLDEVNRAKTSGAGSGGRPSADKEKEKEKEKAAWEKEMEAAKVEGRKWKDQEDNDSLFCY